MFRGPLPPIIQFSVQGPNGWLPVEDVKFEEARRKAHEMRDKLFQP